MASSEREDLPNAAAVKTTASVIEHDREDNDAEVDDEDDNEQQQQQALPSSLDDWQEGNENDMSIIRNCYCPNCGGGHATTTMLPTKVPMFREIIVMTLVCDECYFRNTEVTFGGQIQERGERITLHVSRADDLNRQMIKSDSATLTIPQLELEIPPSTQKGTVSTMEGMLRRAAERLEAGQVQRLQLGDVDNFHRCQRVIDQLTLFANGGVVVDDVDGEREEEEAIDDDDDDDDDDKKHQIEKNSSKKTANEDNAAVVAVFPEFDIILDDPAGNSFIENLFAPHPDPAMTHTKYVRTATQDMSLGLQPSAQAMKEGKIDNDNPLHKNIVNGMFMEPTQQHSPHQLQQQHHHSVEVDETLLHNKNKKKTQLEESAITSDDTKEKSTNDINEDDDDDDVGRQEVIKFHTLCPHCFQNAETDMCVTDIPHFKEVIIMSLVCDACGYKSNEIKGGGAIPKYGSRITVTIRNDDDMAREVLKSDTAGIQIPELELELEEGGLDGMYTTMEGLFKKLYDRLKEANPFGAGDAATKQHLSNDVGNTFSAPSPNHARYLQFLDKLYQMAHGQAFPFTLIISDPLANSFVGPIPRDAMALALQAEQDGNNDCYNLYVDHGMVLEEYERTFEQNEILGLNDMKTENYLEAQHEQAEDETTTKNEDGISSKPVDDSDDKKKPPTLYYGTDQPEEVPDRIRRLDVRGPDHPHAVGKAPVEGDTTVMGAGSVNFAVPGMAQRGKIVSAAASAVAAAEQQQSLHFPGVAVTTTTTTTTTATTTTRAASAGATKTTTSSTDRATDATTACSSAVASSSDDDDESPSHPLLLHQLLHDFEYNDKEFMMNDQYEGPNKGMVYKDGAQGLGYYTDVPLLQLYQEFQQQRKQVHSKKIQEQK